MQQSEQGLWFRHRYKNSVLSCIWSLGHLKQLSTGPALKQQYMSCRQAHGSVNQRVISHVFITT